MAHKELVLALGMIVAGAPVFAATSQPPTTDEPGMVAPAAGPDARYCMRIEITGSRIEKIRCWTREEWAEQEVDVDEEWAENGVRVIEG